MTAPAMDRDEVIADLKKQLADVERQRDLALRKLEERKAIERAKGILMEQHGMTEAEAYRVLQRSSQSNNMKMVEVARAVIISDELSRGR